MTSIRLDQVSLSYNGVDLVVKNLDLTVASGELMALVGPSGCGKTSILRMIAGLQRPTSGEISFDASPVTTIRPEHRGAVMVFQRHALFPFRTALENVTFGLAIRGVSKRDRDRLATEALESVGLGGYRNRWPDELSGGQQQRVAIARALVVRPRILLLDEPLGHLDPELRTEVRHVIVDIAKLEHMTTILVTHDHHVAMAIADTVAVMIGSSIRQRGSPGSIRSCPVDDHVASFLGL